MSRPVPWSTDQMPDLDGKVFVVTGGNTGIGLATARALVARRATVVIGCRSLEKGEKAVAGLHKQFPAASVRSMPLDLANLASVRDFAAGLAHLRHLDCLVNNAGIMMAPRSKTADGFELQFGTNVLGHHLLTGLLLPMLVRTPDARVVTVSSLGHWRGRLDHDNLNGEKSYDPTANYAQSKLANLVLAYELQRRFDRDGLSVKSIGVHPGVTYSDLGRHAGWADLVMRLYGQSTDEGALPSLRAAVDPSVEGGDYIGPSGFLTFKGSPGRQRSSRRSHDKALGARLWEQVGAMTGLYYL